MAALPPGVLNCRWNGKAATVAYKRLAHLLSARRGLPYDDGLASLLFDFFFT